MTCANWGDRSLRDRFGRLGVTVLHVISSLDLNTVLHDGVDCAVRPRAPTRAWSQRSVRESGWWIS